VFVVTVVLCFDVQRLLITVVLLCVVVLGLDVQEADRKASKKDK
jgi:hypothetical protein